jgi:UDP-3-O-acyl N-acetylglucosamine deacetylase
MIQSRFQQTLRRSFSIAGRGYWSGRNVCLTFLPSSVDSGVQFQRVDLPNQPIISALASNCRETALRTRLLGSHDGNEFVVDMIEHIMSALSGMHIDNCIVQCDAEEMPGLDGSSLALARSIQATGIRVQESRQHVLKITEPIFVGNEDQWVEARPRAGFVDTFEYHCDFGNDFPVASAVVAMTHRPADYFAHVAPARTFILETTANELQQQGLARHVTHQDLLVLTDQGPINNTFRFPDECARHKLLDLIGDIALSGVGLQGDIVAHKSGHALNGRLALKIQALAIKQLVPQRSRVITPQTLSQQPYREVA